MKEWYLIDCPSMTSGGFENDVLNEYRDDAMYEMLNTELASTVVLYNFDLSESKTIRCIIQGNSADTQLKSMERVGLFIIGTVKAGMYIFFENRYWLITGYPGTNGIYEKATLQLCQYKLRWQNDKGIIIERWCNATSAAKYDIGESGNKTVTLASDNLTLLLPDDEESLDLDGKRVFIDKRKINPTKVYKITRTDGVLYDYGEHGGVLSFIADKTELNTNNDNQELRICDYKELPYSLPPFKGNNETTDLLATISGNKNVVVGYKRTYEVNFTDSLGNDLDNIAFTWNIVSEFNVQQTADGNVIELLVDDEDCIGSSFLLQIIFADKVIAQNKVTVVENY